MISISQKIIYIFYYDKEQNSQFSVNLDVSSAHIHHMAFLVCYMIKIFVKKLGVNNTAVVVVFFFFWKGFI